MISLKKALDLAFFFFVALALGIGIGLLVGCRSVAPQSDLAKITPPGLVAAKPPVKSTVFFVVSPVATTNITLACDIGSGTWDGINIYEGAEPSNLSLIGQFTNNAAMPVSVNATWPTLLEARTFINWPAPVINCVTNPDGTVDCATNLYYENPNGADFIFVPQGTTNEWPFLNPDGTWTLAGWGVLNAQYQIFTGPLNGLVQVASFAGTNGPWFHRATNEGPYWVARGINP